MFKSAMFRSPRQHRPRSFGGGPRVQPVSLARDPVRAAASSLTYQIKFLDQKSARGHHRRLDHDDVRNGSGF
jgi:hypothetical protein